MDNKQRTKEAIEYINLLQTEGVQTPVDKDVGSYEMTLPDWYDEKLFKRAQEFYMENIFAMFAGKMSGLLAVLSIPSILNVLMFTKGSGISLTAYRRYMQTIFHTMTWYEHELTPGSISWKSLEAVRKRHIISSKAAEKKKAGMITQKDMALTQFGFMGFITIRPDILGIQVSRKKFEAFIHFWRVIGYMIGIDDRFNLCTNSWETTRGRLECVLEDIYRPALENTSPEFDTMADALINGLWCFNPMLNPPSILFYTKYLTNCSGYVYFESSLLALEADLEHSRGLIDSMDWYSRLMLFLQITVHGYLLNFWLFRWYFNLQVWIAKFLITHFPFLAFYQFGVKRSYVQILNGEQELEKTKSI